MAVTLAEFMADSCHYSIITIAAVKIKLVAVKTAASP